MRLHGRLGLGRAARDQPCHRLDVTALALALSGHRRARRFDRRAGLVEALLEKQAHAGTGVGDRKSTRLNSSHGYISYAVFCLKKKKKNRLTIHLPLTT